VSLFELRLPDLGEGIAEGTVDVWFVAAGQEVKEDQPLVEVTTDKATVEIPSPVAGRVRQVLVEPGETVAVDTVLAQLEVEAESTSQAFEKRKPDVGTVDQPVIEPKATPGARRLARELGLDLSLVAECFPGRALKEEDIRAYKDSQVLVVGEQAGQDAKGSSRRTIAERLCKAALIPTVTNVDEVDFEAVMASGVSPLVALCAVVVASLPQHPKLNGWCQDGKLIPQSKIHLGIATQTKAGLVVPVIRDAQDMGVEELAFGIRDVTFRAKEGRLRPEELSGSTFTVTSAGKLAGLWSTPLLNPPEVAILGLYRIEPRAVVTEKGIEAKRRANLSITFDHRVLDGLDAASFLAFVKQGLEDFGSQEGIKDRDQPGSAGLVGD
jgi:pyruvate dehydrogenase E2 component (dihydrolipoamide acetyltransferase)